MSFLLVFLAHCGLQDIVPGGLGVTVFFFLSGFLITTLMRAEYDKVGSVNLRHFWLRRALRILPPFYTVLALTIAVTLLFGPANVLSTPDMTAQALHFVNYWIITHGSGGLPPGTGVYWSLAVEEHFYLLFPWLYIGMRKLTMTGRQQAFLLWTICVVVLAWRCILVLKFNVSMDRTYLATDTRIDSILFGCALAVWNNPVLDVGQLNERSWKFGIVPVALIVLVGCLLFRNQAFRETVRYSLQGIALMPLFIAAVRFPSWLPFRFLNARAVAFTGVLSYSLYLVHDTVIFEVDRYFPMLPSFLQGLLSFTIALGIAWTMYLWIEKPCARLRRKLSE